jgi:aminoglycoside phosphotransferase family enzyme/predicted kinase
MYDQEPAGHHPPRQQPGTTGMHPDLPQALLACLQNPAAYPHAAATIEHFQTHISHVFVAGDYAYKLKKPVDFGFLDFTTLDKRRAVCHDEVRLNARLAPEFYLGVASICRTPAGYRVAPHGCAPDEIEAEVAVQMRRLPQDGMLNRLAAHGQLTLDHMTDIARQLARFHTDARIGAEVERYGSPDYIRAPVMQNFEQTRPYIGRVVSAAVHAHLRARSETFLQTHAAVFAERVRTGYIVDGHGDLHLRNMCQFEGRVVIFDCIEFNPALRAGDTMNDIAFLTMDLDHRALTGHANRFLNDYLEQTRDYAGLKLLDFYQAYRACVRAKVLAFESDAADDARLRTDVEHNSASYFDLAEQYLVPRRAGILLTCGVSGSGKTTLARQAATYLNGVMVRSDAVRKHLAGVGLLERGAQGVDEGIYTPAMTERTYAALRQHAREILTSHRWAILDAVYGRRSERAAAAALAHELGVPFGILYCQVPRAELERRLDQRSAHGRDVSDATAEILDRQTERFEPPSADEGALFLSSGQQDPSAWLSSLRTR